MNCLTFFIIGLLCALERSSNELLHEPKDVAKSQDYKVLERLFEELTKCKEDDQQRKSLVFPPTWPTFYLFLIQTCSAEPRSSNW